MKFKFWQAFKGATKSDERKNAAEHDYEIQRYSEQGGYIRNMVRDGKTQNSAAYGGMGERELQLRLELLVDQVLSSNRSVFQPAQQLAQFSLADQERFLKSVESISRTSVELAYSFCHFATSSLLKIEEYDWEDWITHLLEIYGQQGVNGTITAMKDVDRYIESISSAPASVDFEDVSRILEGVLTGLNGRPLRLESDTQTYTDTETIRVPVNIASFKSKAENFALYKSIAVHQWAQGWFGTWRTDVPSLIARYGNPERALRIFHALETIRLDACIQRELPGLARSMKSQAAPLYSSPLPEPWKTAMQRLADPKASVKDSEDCLAELYALDMLPENALYQGVLLPDVVARTMLLRQQREKDAFSKLVANAVNDAAPQPPNDNNETNEPAQLQQAEIEDDSMPDGYRVELELDGQPLNLPPEVQQLIASIQQDFGEIPDEYLTAASEDIKQADILNAEESSQPMTGEEENVFLYDEWDHSRQKYRKEWCRLREHEIQEQPSTFVEDTLNKHRGLLKHLHRTFEALREEDRRVHRQPYGEDIDIDAVVESYADIINGREADENIFIKQRKVDRNIAVMFMVDMSGSTSGWINDMEREALILLCESLELLGDRYAIYGFSGVTHERCDLYRVKTFDEPYSEAVKNRISGIRPQDYTRMGAAIRHLSKLLGRVEAKTKLLITLSDGRPDDQDGYRGPYGIEDTRRALMESKYLGIHPFCITIDAEAMDYLKHMYGHVNFTIVDEVSKLPYKVSDIYRRITM